MVNIKKILPNKIFLKTIIQEKHFSCHNDNREKMRSHAYCSGSEESMKLYILKKIILQMNF